MQGKTLAKRIVALVLTLVMVAALFPISPTAHAEPVPFKPFYMVNWNQGVELADHMGYVYYMPHTWINKDTITDTTTELTVVMQFTNADGSVTSVDTPEDIAQKMYEVFSGRPEGTRFINLASLRTAMIACMEDVIQMDRGVTLYANWLEKVLAEYKALGGELDGIASDLEIINTSFYYLDYYYYSGTETVEEEGIYPNQNVYNDIAANAFYLEHLRPKLVERGFDFYENYFPTIYPYRSELWSLNPNSGDTYSTSRSIWNELMQEMTVSYINKALFVPLQKHYPDAILSDYDHYDSDSWYKGMDHMGVQSTYHSLKAGNSSSQNYYDDSRSQSFYGYSSETNRTNRTNYLKPAGHNAAVSEDDAFACIQWDVNTQKRILASTDTGITSPWITFFNYGQTGKGWSNTPYYSELIYHLGLTDPQPFLGYIIRGEVEENGQNHDDPNIGNYGYSLGVVNELLTELTRVAGTADREPIQTPIDWNSGYILSGMYASGRNIWRITPDTDKVSMEDFLDTDASVPTFRVGELTVIFPRGRIVADNDITQVGTCGYWVETPENVEPVVTSTKDRYMYDPSFADNFDSYALGTFNAAAVQPNTYWTISGTANIVENGSNNKALKLTGTASVKNTKVTSLITAGDDYAKQQAWEVTFTLPSGGSYGTINLFQTTSNDGLMINGGQVYYYNSSGTYSGNSIASVSNGGTYTAKRVLNFTGSTYYNTYYIYDAAGNQIGTSGSKAMKKITTPVAGITFATTSATNPVLIDDYKLYPVGVTTTFDVYNAANGRKVTNATAAQTQDTAYRLSWMNASDTAKKVNVLSNSTVIATVEMAPGMDGVLTGVVEASAGKSVTLTLSTPEDTTIPEPEIDTDTSWPTMGITCIVGNNGYVTLSDALADAANNDTVILLQDTTMDASAALDKTVHIQGNGKTITLSDTFSGSYAIAAMAGSKLTLTDVNLNAGSKTGIYVSGGMLNASGMSVTTTGTAVKVEQDAAKTRIDVSITDSALSGTKAFEQVGTATDTERNIYAFVTDTAISGTVASDTAFPVKWDAANAFHLHWETAADASVEQTCVETGLTEGSHYVCCGETKVAQTVIPANGHSWNNATCTVCSYTKPSIQINYKDGSNDSRVTLRPEAGATLRYWSIENGCMKFQAGYTENSNWNVKLTYSDDGVPTMTLRNAILHNDRPLYFCAVNADNLNYGDPVTSDINLVLEGTNKISSSKTNDYYPIFFNIDSTSTATISGTGTLEVSCSSATALIRCKGNLVLDHANIIVDAVSAGNCNGIGIEAAGNMTVKGGSLRVTGYNTNSGDYYYVFAPFNQGIKAHNLTVQDSADVKVYGALSNNATALVDVGGTFTIQDSDVELGMLQNSYVNKVLQANMDVDFTNGSYTVKTSTTSGTYDYSNHAFTAPAEPDIYTNIADVPLSDMRYFKVSAAPAFGESSIIAGNDLTLRYRINKAEVDDVRGTQVKIERTTANGAATPYYVQLSQDLIAVDEGVIYYVIPYTSIAAKEMGDKVSMTVCNAAGEAVSVTKTDSILQYALRMLDGNDDKLKPLVVDMLNYGAMAQERFGYSTNNPVNAALTAQQAQLGTQEMKYCADSKATVEGVNADAYIGTSFVLENNIAMAMKISSVLGDGCYAKVTFTNYNDLTRVDSKKVADGYVFSYNGLVAADGRCQVTWTFFDAQGNEKLTVVDSMEQYVGRNIDRFTYLDKLMNYSDSALAYFK